MTPKPATPKPVRGWLWRFVAVWSAVGVGCALAAGSMQGSAQGFSRGAAPAEVTTGREAEEFLLGGIQVNEPDPTRWVEALEAAGMNTVAVTVYARQGDWDGDDLTYAETEPSVVQEIREAKRRGLRVVLILRVALDHAFPRNEFLWHGMIMPSDEELLASWFEKYSAFAMQWARIAEVEGVDLLGIGSELKTMTATLPIDRWGNLKNYYAFYWYQRRTRGRTRKFADQIEQRHLWVPWRENYGDVESYARARFDASVAWAQQTYLRGRYPVLKRINRRRRSINEHWIDLISRLRTVYAGRLTYAANFDNYRNVGFWEQLDLMGINAYFPLRDHLEVELSKPELREMFEKRWSRVFGEIRGFQVSHGVEGMPFVFTELGYTFRRHCSVEPWAGDGFSVVGWKGHKRDLIVWRDQPVDYQERRLIVDALANTHQATNPGQARLGGILYWKLSTIPEHEAIEPFVLLIDPNSNDPLLGALSRTGVDSELRW